MRLVNNDSHRADAQQSANLLPQEDDDGKCKYLVNNHFKQASSLFVWFVFNASTVIFNKYLYEAYDFRFPITLTAIHMLTSSLMAFLFLRVLKVHPFTPISGDQTGVYYLSVIFVVNILLGNFSLQYIPVSFMQAIKSTVPAFTVFLQVFVMGQHFRTSIYYALIPIVGGVAFASTHEVNFDMTGFVCALLASLTTAAQTTMSSKLLTTKLDAVNLIYYLGPISFFMLFPFVIFWDLPVIQSDWIYLDDSSALYALTFSGIAAFMLSMLLST
eukprot:TRINITY_DN12509_c0_g1_i6.p1 TRINITY_DN12509_c0_g1~~TRINITY_DN12509_c0_g1_i6.p1  ORF type:complete len:272 (+),score=49.77 TRINITY_DN12509_c0_g1_i6:46-861(+)